MQRQGQKRPCLFFRPEDAAKDWGASGDIGKAAPENIIPPRL
jgi:hypothetical protein